MKKTYALLALLIMAVCVGFTSCDDDIYGPPGQSYDPDLLGTWELYSADGVPVYGYQVNWLEFNRNGTGTYYYYHNGREYSMGLYWGVDWYGGEQELYIDYNDGSSASMYYWFNSNATFLYTEWYERGYRHTYIYRYVDYPAWSPRKAAPSNGAGMEPAALQPLTAPGL